MSHPAPGKTDDGPHTTQKSFKSDRRDKPKHSGKTGATAGPKKGGGGGKGTWGRPGDETREEDLDPNDPNYDPDEEAAAHTPASSSQQRGWDFEPAAQQQLKFASSLEDLGAFKKTIKSAAKEYLQSNDTGEFIRILNAAGMSVFHQDLPYILIKYSFDVSDAERVRVSNLLGALAKNGLITRAQMGAGVRKLYNTMGDLLVDSPHAKIQLREHIQFAIAGGFLDASLAKQLEEEAVALEDVAKVSQLKKRIDGIVLEFFASEDLPDAVAAIRELSAPHLLFEVVKRLISHSLDQSHRQREGCSVFLADQTGSLLSQSDCEKGFTHLLERIEDLTLDVPNALKYLSIFIARAQVDEVLPPAFLVRADLAADDAGSQVIRQAQQLLKQDNASDALLYVWETLAEEEANKKKALEQPQK